MLEVLNERYFKNSYRERKTGETSTPCYVNYNTMSQKLYHVLKAIIETLSIVMEVQRRDRI